MTVIQGTRFPSPAKVQTNFSNAPRHEQSDYCQAMMQKWCQHRNDAASAKAPDKSFTAYDVKVETVESFNPGHPHESGKSEIDVGLTLAGSKGG